MPKIAKLLTQKEIDALKFGDHAVGGRGLYIKKRETFSCYYVRIRKNGAEYTRYLSGVKSLKRARQIAEEIQEMVKNGIDPREEEKRLAEETARQKEEAENAERLKRATFHVVFDEYYREIMVKGLNNPEREFNRVRNHVFPLIGDKPINEITHRDLYTVFDPLYRTKGETARRVLTRVEECFLYAKSLGTYGIIQNPCNEELKLLLAPAKKVKKETQNRPALPYKQLPKFIKLLLEIGGVDSLMFVFSLLTSARSQAVRLAQWKEIDFEEDKWIISLEHDKQKRADPRKRTIFLSTQAIQILKSLPRFSDDAFIFPSGVKRNGATTNYSDGQFSKLIKRLNNSPEFLGGVDLHDPNVLDEFGKPSLITQHGTVRSGFKTWARDDVSENFKKYDEQAVEYCMLHFRDAYNGAYDRANMVKHRREIMQDWGDFCISEKELQDYLNKE
ncbi:integrase arm-type DNA-binding domain-containing protein [uncultured Parasutterella sp.]|mgnify:FL=1|uniref:tyrosine-type recombinase/integrase n=1 Tax=uncultured Parasutterella sp. TaxID=1263098 RepID=UPI0025B65E4D|nr:integrase arm-type DNA-binding domain-containing protein [uncultured Parasutterella sp.]